MPMTEDLSQFFNVDEFGTTIAWADDVDNGSFVGIVDRGFVEVLEIEGEMWRVHCQVGALTYPGTGTTTLTIPHGIGTMTAIVIARELDESGLVQNLILEES